MASTRYTRRSTTATSVAEQLHNLLTGAAGLSDDEAARVAGAFHELHAPKGEILVAFGDTCRYLYFIGTGCLRLFGVDKDGNDVTSKFSFENSFLTTLTSFIDGKPSRDCLMAYEPSLLLRIDRSVFLDLAGTIPALGQYYNQIVQFAFIHSQMRVYSFLGMEGIEKVRWVLEHEPELLVRVSSKAVASYLGMTNATLSKLRARLKERSSVV